jgi:hypothetical protein
MGRPLRRRVLAVAVAFLTAAAAAAQFVPLSRCHAAYPCAIPFEIQYRPDPLIAGQYGGPGSTAVSLRAPLTSTFAPQIDARQVDQAAVDAAVRSFLRTHPGVKPGTTEKEVSR